MKIKITFLTALAFICGLQASLAQNLSNKGREFWVGYGHHQFMETGSNTQEMVLYLSAEQAANVTVTIDGTAWVRNYVIPANTVIVSDLIPKSGVNDARLISLPCTFVPPGTPCGGEGIFVNKGIHIVSDVPIVAYAHIYGSASSGATMLMPVETWGYSYMTINSKQEYQPNCFSWVYAIAQYDNTLIEVIPAATTRTGRPANVPYTILLQKGQIYQTMAGPEAGSSKPEMSGTKIKSIANASGNCYPIAVFAGSSRTYGTPVSCGSASGGDNDNQQCFPIQAWGKRYLTAPTSNSTTASTPMWNTFKIAVRDPATTQVWRNGTLMTGINPAGYYEFISNQAEYITSDKPVMVSQFIHSGTACQGGSGVGDPEMMYISPIEQGIKRIGFYRNTQQSITVNYLTLIIPTAGISSLLINGSSTFDHVYAHPRLAGYSVVVKRWPAAQVQATAQSDSAFTAITYGLGTVESYGYNAGTLINNLNAVGSIFNVSDTSTTTTSHPFTCTNTPVKLSVLLGYPTPPTRLVWLISQVGGGISPNVDVIDNAPTPVGTSIVNGVTYYKYDLAGTYTFSQTGNFEIPILATHPTVDNCNNTERVSYFLEVRGKPTAGYTFTHTGCVLDSVHFNGPDTSTQGYNINQWLWTYPGGSTDNIEDPAHLFTTTGNHNVNMHIVTTEGCVSDTIMTVPVFPKPVTNFTTIPASVCEGGTITFTENTTFGGSGPINNYYWNFGNGTSTTVGPHTITYNTPGLYNVQHTAGVSTACVSDTVVRPVRVWAKPTATFSYPAGCLPASGVVQFTSTASTPDGQAITGHSWNFGDPASGAANTSTLANPTHTYPSFGTYTITYSVSTANGCTNNSIVNATFNLSPTFSYPALAPVCQSVTAPVSVATASVTNGVPGTGVYHGPATTLAGMFSPWIAGAGTHTIWYVFAATSGCTDSVSQTIVVHPKPNASFTYPLTCLPASGLAQFTYNGTAATSYLWNFGDPGSGSNTSTLQNPTHVYATAGSYPIQLNVINANGCTDDTTLTAVFNITPALSYPALAPVCQSVAGTISVATATVTNGVAGTGVYSGPGTDPAGNFNPSVAGAGTHTITYTFTSSAGNCVASITSTITVGAKPNSSFTYTPTTACLPTTGLVQFTYNGTAVTSYAWNFGDPASGAANTSTLQNPTHVYSNTGTYNISLNVTGANGCTDDTTITRVFSVTPALSYPALPSVCESVAGTVSVATATVTNGVSGTGVYSGPGTDAAGNFNPAVAGGGTHTITYTFTSTGNCVATATSTVTVGAKPNASFTYTPTTPCLPTTGLVQFTYNGSAVTSYTWNFGDPASGAANTSTLQNPTHVYSNTGSYIISLSVTGANGCTDDTTITRVFSVTPALSYPALTSLCESVPGTVSVATATVTNGVSGTGVYSGNGTDAAGNFSPSAAGLGTHTITYAFTSTGNCVATATSTITVLAKPNASFTYTPATPCLPTTGLVQFTYNGSAVTSYAWNFGDPASGAANTSTLQNPTHNYTNTGSYIISLAVTGANGCTDDTTITRVFSVTPALSYPALTSLCQSVPGTVSVATATVTNGVSGTGIYSGPGTDAAGNFAPSAAGPGTHTITYTFTSTGNCVATATSTITVLAKPNASFTYTPATACLPTTGLVQFTYNGSAVTSYAWNFGDPASGAANTSTLQNPTHVYSNTGSYNISLNVTGANGCTDDTTITRVFSVTPALSYPALTSLCQSVPGTVSVATATVTNGVSGTGVYSGPGTDAAGNFSPSAAGPGTHIITYTFTSTGNCVATATSTITVLAKPNASFTYTPTTACLPTNGQVQFTYNGTAASSYAWDFGDPASGAANTSTLQNPTHNYSNTGSHAISLIATGANGCTDDTTVTRTFSVTPALNYAPLSAPVCESATGTISVATATVTNGVSGTGVYSGAGTDAAGNFSPAAAGPGTHTITYTFTSTGNCVATATRQITVNPKPSAIFSINADMCTNETALITDASTIASGNINTWNWYFGDNTTAVNFNGNPFNHNYTIPGSYTIKLVAISDSGCISDTARRTIAVHSVPFVNFGMPSAVCMPDGAVAFTNSSSSSDGSAMTYQWDFGDVSGSTAVNPSHVYAASGSYNITLTATTSFGCVHDTIKTFSAFFEKPIAQFTLSPSAVCQGNTITFNTPSGGPGTPITEFLWLFGDGTTATSANYIKMYSQAGVYNVRLLVKNNQGCVSDTSAPQTATVYRQPAINAGPSMAVPYGTMVQLQAESNSPLFTYMWTPGGLLSDDGVLNPMYLANADATFTLTATGDGGCTDTDDVTIKVLKPVKMTNAFSPNGDGINDTWIIDNLNDYPGSKVQIFNRYGQIVFSSNGYSNPWDGTMKGKSLPVATYYYIIDLMNGFKPLNGSITLIR